jgi:uncharacterized protein (UPF0261 family)
MTKKTIVLVGALDTKGRELQFVKEVIAGRGLNVVVVDFGVLGEPAFVPDIRRAEIVEAAGGDLSRLRSGDHKNEAMKTMSDGLAVVIRRLHDEGRLQGILGMGGTGGTSIATAAMRSLPVGVPKLMVSTVGGGDVSAYAGTKDITFMPSIVDVAGFNPISRRIYANAAGAIAGMVEAVHPTSGEERPLIGASMFGNTTPVVNRARARLEKRGYEVVVFHATGIGGRTMEDLVEAGYFQGLLDITTTELADEVCGGVMSAGPLRGHAAPRAGIPVVFAPGCVDMANFGGRDSVPERYRGRVLYEWNPNVTLLRTNPEESVQIGRMLAEAANAATGPAAVLLPLKGVSQLDAPGGAFWDPAADGACYEAIRSHLLPSVRLANVDCNINDEEFADLTTDTLVAMIKERS